MILERFEDYAIKIADSSGEYHLAFEVKVITGETVEPPPSGLWLYKLHGGSSSADTTTEFDEGKMFLHGFVKWDGCSNWDFHTDGVMTHFCGRTQASGIGRLLDHLYQITQERLPTFEASLAC